MPLLKTLDNVKDEAVNKKESDIYEEAYLEEIKYRVITEDREDHILMSWIGNVAEFRQSLLEEIHEVLPTTVCNATNR